MSTRTLTFLNRPAYEIRMNEIDSDMKIENKSDLKLILDILLEGYECKFSDGREVDSYTRRLIFGLVFCDTVMSHSGCKVSKDTLKEFFDELGSIKI